MVCFWIRWAPSLTLSRSQVNFHYSSAHHPNNPLGQPDTEYIAIIVVVIDNNGGLASIGQQQERLFESGKRVATDFRDIPFHKIFEGFGGHGELVTKREELEPALKRRNLSLEINSHTLRILTDRTKATGVKFEQNGEVKTATAEKGVVVCAGAIQSPQLLELSGIGNPDILSRHGIELVHPLPGVG